MFCVNCIYMNCEGCEGREWGREGGCSEAEGADDGRDLVLGRVQYRKCQLRWKGEEGGANA